LPGSVGGFKNSFVGSCRKLDIRFRLTFLVGFDL